MNSEERTGSYIRSLYAEEAPLLEEIYEEALKENIPVIRRELMGFLKTLFQICRPLKILELGTAVGFSSIFMAAVSGMESIHQSDGSREEAVRSAAGITTIEKSEKNYNRALENISRTGMQDRITVIRGDASDILKELEGPYDFVFMDAAKAQYIHWLPEIKRLMREGSVLLADNIFREGDILESRFLIERRDRTIHKRMREYLYAVTHDPELCTSLLNVGDGVSLSVMRH